MQPSFPHHRSSSRVSIARKPRPRHEPRLLLKFCFSTIAVALAATAAHAGGTPENMFLIVDPTNPDSLYVANYYRNARDIPPENVLYFAPGAANYATFADVNLDALFGTLANKSIDDHIDYIVVMPGAPYYVSAPGLVSDSCAPVSQFSISSVYTMAFLSETILTGTLSSTYANQYYNTPSTLPFDSSFGWQGGYPSEWPGSPHYFIGVLLGYTGERGNTVEELLAMIDRSVAVDGTRPAGTFYFMNNTSDPDRNVRAYQFPGTVSDIIAYGGQAQTIVGVLPVGHQDCLGIMTGAASPAIDTADMTILPGAFCDHLTSYAAHFGTSSQVKLSRWIVRGASGSWGAVQEPCNYVGKFPEAALHRLYFEGLSLGEAALRSAHYVPFQMLLYGDPMTRPFAYLPVVTVADAPTSPVSGVIRLTPSATTAHPDAAIAGFDLLIDGRLQESILPGEGFALDTAALPDGWHDMRVLAYDDSVVRSVGRWTGELVTNNRNRAVSLAVDPMEGDRSTPFEMTVSAVGGPLREVRIVQNGRVLAASTGSAATFTLFGLTLGAGPAMVRAEALFQSGETVRSAPVNLAVTPADGVPSGAAPVAFGYTKRVLRDHPFVVELPATIDDPSAPLTFEIVTPPDMATVVEDQTGPYRLMRPQPNAAGADTFTFHATGPSGTSAEVTVTLVYQWWFGDLNCDGAASAFDIDPFVLALTDPAAYRVAYPDCNPADADINGDGAVNAFDIDPFVRLLTGG